MENTADMSPEASPDTPAPRSGVRRVNNLPVYLIGGVIAGFLLVMALVAADRAEKQQRTPEASEQKATSTDMFANELAGKEKDGIVPEAKTSPPEVPTLSNAEPAALPARPTTLEAPPAPPAIPTPQAGTQEQDPSVRIKQEKMHMLEEAVRAHTAVQMIAPRSPGSASASLQKTSLSREEAIDRIAFARQQEDAAAADSAAAYRARLQQLQMDGMQVQASNSSAAPPGNLLEQSAPPALSPGKTYHQFDRSAQEDRWRLDSQLQPPRSLYELRAGFVLPAILISGINSDLPGMVMGQVSQDVFDTATGKWKLIPQGSRLIGQYSSDVAYGQARVLIAWQRIVFPDGKALDLGAMPGADSAGYAGFHDQVNNHYLRVFGSALLMSGVTAGIALSQPESSYYDRRSARGAMSEALGQQLGQITAQMIAKNMGISPTLEIRPGYRFNVVVTKDLTFSKPYKPFDY